ncbi:MAG TPA: hypothetical protein VKS79_21635 [Gemmataceae bacterium]|nr:hypothetical protein [Gemmataceae bacterium]
MRRILLTLGMAMMLASSVQADIRPLPEAQPRRAKIESKWGPRWLWIAGGSAAGAVLAVVGAVVLRARRK